MNSKRLTIGSIICLIWWVKEILSNPINGKNGTDIVMMPFTINANPESTENSTTKTLKLISSTAKPYISTTVKASKIITTEEIKPVFPTAHSFPKNHKPSFQPHTEPKNLEAIRGKQQKWQIPSPIQLTTPDPKEANSSKRQIIMEKFSEPEFVPSLQVGSFDNTEGFVPKVHEPKTLNFVQSMYAIKDAKPNRHDVSYEPSAFDIKESNFQNKQYTQQTIGSSNFNRQTGSGSSSKRQQNLQSNKKFSNESPLSKTFPSALGLRNNHSNRKKNNGSNRRNPNRRQELMDEFQKDFNKLVYKYPELGDIVHNYPMMEEIMKQKLAEKFEKSNYYHQQQYSDEEYDDSSSEEDEGGEDDGKLKFNSNQGLPYKYTNYKFPSDEDSNVNIYEHNPQTFEGVPYPFEGKKPSWSYKKKPDDVHQNIPAGGYYQDTKFPPLDDQQSDKKPIEEDNPLNVDVHERPSMSPWKRAVHMLTAFLPVGLLISALTPNIININNTTDQSIFPLRQRSADWNHPATKFSNQLVEKLQGKFYDLESLRLAKGVSDNPVCDDWNFCEIAKKGSEPDAVAIEKVFWQLAHEVPEHVAEKNGMKKLFKAIKSKDCSQFVCKANQKQNVGDGNDEKHKESPFELEEMDDEQDVVNFDESPEAISSVKKDEPRRVKGDNKDNTDSLLIRVL